MPSKTTTSGSAAPLSEDAIRMRAYFMWEADGRPDGAADHYWGRAIAELAPSSEAATKLAARSAAANSAAAAVTAKPKLAKPAKAKASTKPAKGKKKS